MDPRGSVIHGLLTAQIGTTPLASSAALVSSNHLSETSHQQPTFPLATPSTNPLTMNVATMMTTHTKDSDVFLPDKRWKAEVGPQVTVELTVEANVESVTKDTNSCFVFNVCNPTKKFDKKILDHVFYAYNVQTKVSCAWL